MEAVRGTDDRSAGLGHRVTDWFVQTGAQEDAGKIRFGRTSPGCPWHP